MPQKVGSVFFEKMQIVKINEKDIKDVIATVREHNIGSTEDETINSKYIAKTLANDWGFYYTVTTNIEKVQGFLNRYRSLTAEDRADVTTKLNQILHCIERAPKSLSWRMHARIGTKKKWYTDVEAFEEVGLL